jgi:serine phosphatase RsbU (regulator of sigma subunit)
VIERLAAAVSEFAGPEKQDDMTLIALKAVG